MAIFVNSSTRLIVQGITGREGRFHTQKMIDYGTEIVGGVTPGKGGEWIHGKPVFETVQRAVETTEANTSIIFVSAPQAADAIYEAADAGIELVVCITDGIPIQDMTAVSQYLRGKNCRLIGPNCPGIITPGQTNVGIIPGYVAAPGHVGIISKSGSLTYNILHSLTKAGIGQSTCVGVGGDPIIGTGFMEILRRFEDDPDTEKVILIGEIGGVGEINAAHFIKSSMTKPVYAYIAGKNVPYGVRLGHAGAIIEDNGESAYDKVTALQYAGVRVVDNPEDFPQVLQSDSF